jgi:hypothetical protein
VIEAERVLDLEGWRGSSSIYAAVLGHLSARRLGQAAQAKSFLDAAAARCDTSDWSYPIVRYLRGEIDESKVLAPATDDDKKTQAHFLLGLDSLQKGRREAALAHFRWVGEHGSPLDPQDTIARTELDRLGGK